jgi:hypothetical protein
MPEESLHSRIESRTAQLSERNLIVKKIEGGGGKTVTKQTCSFCKKEGHYAGRCELNSDKDIQCASCNKYGHRATNCWSSNQIENERRIETATVAREVEGSTKNNSAGEIMAITENDIIVAAERGLDGEPIPKVHRTDERISIQILKPERHAKQIKKDENIKIIAGRYGNFPVVLRSTSCRVRYLKHLLV